MPALALILFIFIIDFYLLLRGKVEQFLWISRKKYRYKYMYWSQSHYTWLSCQDYIKNIYNSFMLSWDEMSKIHKNKVEKYFTYIFLIFARIISIALCAFVSIKIDDTLNMSHQFFLENDLIDRCICKVHI